MGRTFFMGAPPPVLAARASDLRSPNGTVRIACAGVRGQGRTHLRRFGGIRNVEVVAVCDVDENVLRARAGGRRTYVDFRKLLEDRSIDAVSIATPNHWHALQTIWACQAGKDVYVEKPCTHDLFESRQIVAAAARYGRIVQHGTNCRSGIAREAVAKLREGVVGDVYMARGLCFKWRDAIGAYGPEPVPRGVHYDLWLGPAPERGFTRNRFHYNWHWMWDYGNGDLGNQGIHQLDVARWGLGVRYPVKVSASGGRFLFEDDKETPNTLTAMFEFAGGARRKLLVFEVRHWITNSEAGITGGFRNKNCIGATFYGTKGYLTVQDEDHGSYHSVLGREGRPGPSAKEKGNHFENFIQAVRSRKPEDLNAPVEEGAISSALVHLANVSYRLGRTLAFDPETLTCPGDEEANALFRPPYRAPFVVPERV